MTSKSQALSARMKTYRRGLFEEYLLARSQVEQMTPQLLITFAGEKISILEQIAAALGKLSTEHADIPVIRFAIHELRRTVPTVESHGPGKGRRPNISLPSQEVSLADLERIRGSRYGARAPHLIFTYREILGAARRAGLPEVLNRDSLLVFKAELEARKLSAKSRLMKICECRRLCELWDLESDTMSLLINEQRAAQITADREPSQRHAAFRTAPLTPLDYARAARAVSEEAFRRAGNRQSLHRLIVTAAALALLSFIPERIGDVLKLVIGRDVTRDAHGWSSHYFSEKTQVDRSVEYLPVELTPYLDDLVLLGSDAGPQGRDLLRLYRLRGSIGSPLFARINLRTAYSRTRIFELVKEQTGHGPHAARKAIQARAAHLPVNHHWDEVEPGCAFPTVLCAGCHAVLDPQIPSGHAIVRGETVVVAHDDEIIASLTKNSRAAFGEGDHLCAQCIGGHLSVRNLTIPPGYRYDERANRTQSGDKNA